MTGRKKKGRGERRKAVKEGMKENRKEDRFSSCQEKELNTGYLVQEHSLEVC